MSRDAGHSTSSAAHILQIVCQSSTLAPWLYQTNQTLHHHSRLTLAPTHKLPLAALIHQTHTPTLLVTDTLRDLLEIHNALTLWLPEREIFTVKEILSADDILTDEFTTARFERDRTLSLLAATRTQYPAPHTSPPIILTTAHVLSQPLPHPETFLQHRLTIHSGTLCDPTALRTRLLEAGYEPVAQVDAPGQFAARGGVLDIFSTDARLPIRIEWDDQRIETLHTFDPATQRRGTALTHATILTSTHDSDTTATLADYLPANTLTITFDPENGLPAPLIPEHDYLHTTTRDTLAFDTRTALLARHVRDWLAHGWHIHIAAQNAGEISRLREILAGHHPDWPAQITFHTLPLARGFLLPDDKFTLLTDAEIFHRTLVAAPTRATRQSLLERRASGIADITELIEGDYVVHLQHGIGRYLGIHPINLGGPHDEEVLLLEYADAARLYVPLAQAHLVSRYIGAGKARPELDTLGGTRWERKKISAHRAILDYAAKLLALQAERELHPGHAFAPDTHWQQEFEDSFPYPLTPDQATAVQDIKRDMESPRPMDRLLCGDVGFGKTEVAIRAAFKAIMDGRQVIVLCPTSVLARQHYHTFSGRMSDYPITIRLMSRFQNTAQTRAILEECATGKCDLLIGTHRILSSKVLFARPGLLIVDEEQRFGVRDKERIKERFPRIDVLTLSATPIPRTLYLSLMGARDLSTIETPPPGRIPVETHVLAYDERIIRSAIQRELERGGQVFYLHNRIASLDTICTKLRTLLPGLRVLGAHGRMDEDDIERTFTDFLDGRADVLVTTTIIESGIDMPNVNTILIDRADRFGLADLYQLRGRVGRSTQQAYAYLFFPPAMMSAGETRKRAAAIRQYRELGSGFKIAMRDLEIRGAGNLLGTEQSGHIAAIGFDLYCRVLKESIEQLKSGRIPLRREVPLTLDFLSLRDTDPGEGRLSAHLPATFLPDPAQRIAAYRELAELDSPAACDALEARWRDVFGKLPAPVRHLIDYHRIRTTALQGGLTAVECRDGRLSLRRGDTLLTHAGKLPRLASDDPRDWPDEILDWIRRLSK